MNLIISRGYPLSTYAKMLVMLEMLVFRKILRTCLMDDPQHHIAPEKLIGKVKQILTKIINILVKFSCN